MSLPGADRFASVPAPFWRHPALRRAAGETLRPGGFTLTDRACELAGLAPGWTVLDVGCGRGATPLRLRSRFGAKAVGLDLDPQPCEGVRPPLVRGSAQSLPFRDGSFRMVLCECVLSLVPEPDAALAELRRVLTKDGVLALSDLYRKDGHTAPSCSGDSCANSASTRTVLLDRLTRAGFRVQCFEDHSSLLRDLAARLAWEDASPAACPGGPATGYALVLAVADQPETPMRG